MQAFENMAIVCPADNTQFTGGIYASNLCLHDCKK
jgi:hypothetical protein